MYSSSMKVGLRLPQTEKHRATKENIINLAKGAENAKIFNIAGVHQWYCEIASILVPRQQQ